MSSRVVGDLSKLPGSGFGSHSLWFWAAAGFMTIEGTGFALACASYLYLMHNAAQWPLEGSPPDLLWGTAQTVVMLLSVIPNMLASRAARRRQVGPARLWMVVLTLMTAGGLAVRAMEFPHLNTRWDADAYGSITWALMVLHTTHILTDFIDSGFLSVFLFTHPVDTDRLSDIDDDSVYWNFVVIAWLPIYALVYWAPRLVG